MKNKNLIVIIIMMIMTNISRAQNSTCNLNLPGNMEVITLSNIVANDINYENKHIIIGAIGGSPVHLKGNAKFRNCRITLNKMLTYDWGKKIEFYQCEIHFEHGSALRFSGNWAESFAEIIFEGNCITGNEPAELLHVNDGGLRFINNNMTINSFAHIFHIYNPSPYFDNSFYGNNITNTSSENQGIISMANTTLADFKIGDNSHAKNIFLNVNNKIISELGTNNKNLIIENSEFKSNSYGINYGPSVSVDNCKFQSAGDEVKGIGIQSNNNISCTNVTFSKLNMGIHSTNGDLVVESSNFSNINSAIKVSKSSRGGDGEIKNNNFSANTIDVHLTGAFKELEVSSNNFSGQEYGFLAEGDNFYKLEKNAFYNSYAGNIAYANGGNTNFVRNNQYSTLIGTHALEDNTLFQFTDNCYTTAGGDVYLDGAISDVIGSIDGEANNLFTKGGVPDISANSSQFFYFKNDLSTGREDPVTPGTYSEENADIKDDISCGSGSSFTSTIRNYCNINFKLTTCKQAKDLLVTILKEITDIEKEIKELEKIHDKSYKIKVKTTILKGLNNCKVRILTFLKTCINPVPHDPRFPDGEISSSVWTGNEPQQASTALKTSSDKYERAEYISTMIHLGNFIELNEYLQNYSAEDDEDADFVAVQKINVARCLSTDEYVATENDLYTLQQAALKPFPLAGYARGLYTQLTGDIIMPPIPRITFNRTSHGVHDISLFNLMPNPFTDQLTISLMSLQSSEIHITDITGKTYYQSGLLDNQVDVNTSSWPSGIYFVVCTNEKGIGECKKLVKQ